MTHHSITTAFLIVTSTLILSGCGGSSVPSPSPAGFTTVTFPNGKVQFTVPESYSQQSEPDDTIAITPGDNSGIVFRLNLHNLPEAIAEDFLASQAKDKGLQIKTIGGKSTFSETGTRSEGGRDYDMTFWQVGFGDSLVVMSAEVDRKHKGDQVVIDSVSGVPAIIESMRKY